MKEPSISPRRWQHFALALGCWGTLAVSLWLHPDPRGYGTHEQLGLPPCGFRLLTGHPCPGCGGTTAFAWAARGHWVEAFRLHVAGAVLAGLCYVAGATEVLLGLGWLRRAHRFRATYIAVALAATAIQLVRWTWSWLAGS